ncbi:MAG: hypothetical protein GXO23_01900 [Crenarchaeota archaeon]|nr:hypothetical protein [Thermoproteota archaeon]
MVRMELCVVSCGKRKIWDTYRNVPARVPACKAYTGTLTRLAIKYAETFYPGSWLILSGKYGLLFPWEEIENYNKKLVKVDDRFISLLRSQIEEKDLMKYSRVLILGGENYVKACELAFKSFNIEVMAPLRGLSMFARMRVLSEALKRGLKIEYMLCRT